MTNSSNNQNQKKASDQTVDVSPIEIKPKQLSRNQLKQPGKNIAVKSNSKSQSSRSTKNQKTNSDNPRIKNNQKIIFSSMEGSNKGIALGLIETRGMVPAVEAADAMTKAAEVILVAREYVGGGYVTVMVRGETGAVNASVRAGADACERVGDGLVAADIIARPNDEIEPVLRFSGAIRRS